MHRGVLVLVSVLALAAVTLAEDNEPPQNTVATSNGVVVHAVDTKLLAARLRDVDRKTLAGDAKGAASDLAEILTGDVSPLIEDGDNSYLCAAEAAQQRILALPPEGLAAYRSIVDPRAAKLLAETTARADASLLAGRAQTLALSSEGPRLLVTLADLRCARGEVRLAAQALSDLLRLWPDAGPTAQMPGVERAAVVARLGALLAALGDESSVHWLLRETSTKLLEAGSPAGGDSTLAAYLQRCAAASAARRSASNALQRGPTGPLHVAGELLFDAERSGPDSSNSREVPEHPIPIGTAERPMLLTREPAGPATPGRVVALSPSAQGEKRTLSTAWAWPSKEELAAKTRRRGYGPFHVGRSGDVILFPWPAAPRELRPGDPERFDVDGHWTLVALSISAEGRLVDERGVDEEGRDDADPELATLSFCGTPLVVDGAVFVTAVRRSAIGDMTELHLVRFDLVDEGTSKRLRERWRRHLLDGRAMSPVTFGGHLNADPVPDPLALPGSPAEVLGRIVVVSNTGAVACVEASDGRPMWVHSYPRFGPSPRHVVLEVRTAVQRTWGDVPVLVDGPTAWAAPRDADFLFEFDDMPRAARTTLERSFRFHGASGTSTEQGQLLPNLLPDEPVALLDGVGYFAGRVLSLRVENLVPTGSPLVSLRMRPALPGEPKHRTAFAQIPEGAPSGSACLVDGAILLPTCKAIYRVPLAQFEAAPATLYQPPGPPPRNASPPDQIGNLVPDGARLWSVTPKRVVLFEGK